MSYALTFSHRDDTLVAQVIGHRSYFVEDMIADAKAVWHHIAQECVQRAAQSILVRWDVTGPLSTDKASQIGKSFGHPDWPRDVRIAYVERDPASLRISDHGVKLAAARGYDVRSFSNEGDALGWLRTKGVAQHVG